MELEFLQQNFEKFSNIKSDENPFLRAELFHVKWQTDGWKDL